MYLYYVMHVRATGVQLKIVIKDLLFDRPLEYTEQVKKFSIADFEDMFIQHGLQVTMIFGDYRLNEHDAENSPRIILMAVKKQ